MSIGRAKRKEQRAINYGTAVFAVALTASALSPVVEMVVGWAVVVVLVLLGIRWAWPYTVGEWLKDRALVREVGRWDDPTTLPILLVNPDGTETVIGPNDAAYPAAAVQRAAAGRDGPARGPGAVTR